MMKLKNHAVIVGAGLAGLSAGIALQQKGIPTAIYEMAPWAGGVCTAWVRKGYTFDGCIHWMVGTRKGDPMRKLYEEVGALDQTTEMFHAESITLDIDGEIVVVPMDAKRFETLLSTLSPNDAPTIRRLCAAIRQIGRSILLPGTPANLKTSSSP